MSRNPFRSPLRRLVLIGVAPVSALLAAVILYLPAVQAGITENVPVIGYEQIR